MFYLAGVLVLKDKYYKQLFNKFIRTLSTQQNDGDKAKIEHILSLAIGTTSLPPESSIPDIVALLGEARESIISEIAIKKQTSIVLIFLTNNFGDRKTKFSSSTLQEKMTLEQVKLISKIKRGGWNIGLFTKYIVGYQILRAEAEKIISEPHIKTQKKGIIAVEKKLLPQTMPQINKKIYEIEQITKDNVDPDLFDYKLSFKYIFFSCKNSKLADNQNRRVLNELLCRYYYDLAVSAKLVSEKFSIDGFDLSGTINQLSLSSVKVGNKRVQEIISEALYTPCLSLSPKQLLFSPSYTLSRVQKEGFKNYTSIVQKRIIFDHKFEGVFNRWLFKKNIQSDIKEFSGKYFVYSDIHNLAKGGVVHTQEKNRILSLGNQNKIMQASEKYLDGKVSLDCLLKEAYKERLKGENYLNDYFSQLAHHLFSCNGMLLPSYYLDVGDQIVGVVSRPMLAVSAFLQASRNTGYKYFSGLGIVKINDVNTYGSIIKKAEYCVHVTKMFKGVDNKWSTFQIWGDPFSNAKIEAVFNITNKWIDGGNNKKYLLEMVKFRKEWSFHLPTIYKKEMSRLLSQIC